MPSRVVRGLASSTGPGDYRAMAFGSNGAFKSWFSASGHDPTSTGDPRSVQTVFTDGVNRARIDLTNGLVQGQYLLSCVWGVQSLNAASANEGAVTIREGADTVGNEYTSSTDPERIFDHEHEGSAAAWRFTGATWNGRRPITGETPNWTVAHGNAVAGTNTLIGVTLLVIPVSAGVNVPEIDSPPVVHTLPSAGFEKSEVFNQTGGTQEYNDASVADQDLLLTPTDPEFIIEHGNEDYIMFFRAQPRTNTEAAARRLRWSFWVDGEDIFNVRTNILTAGATSTGRGFQLRAPLDSFTGPYSMPFVVKRLQAKTYSWYTVCNRFQVTDSDEQLRNVGLLIFRTRMFSKFTSMEHTSAIVSNNANFAASPFTVTVNSDGQTPVVLMFSTSSHHTGGGGSQWSITRNGTHIMPTSTAAGFSFGATSPQNFADGANGTGDSDNETLPITLLWVDDTPIAGNNVYTIQYRQAPTLGAGIWNCRDDGSSGFKGYFAAFEAKFATTGF